MSLIHTLRSETLKTKRGATLYFTLVAAAIIPIIFLLEVCDDGISPESRQDPFNALFKQGFEIVTLIFFPIYVVVVCTLLPQIEYRNNTWKQVFASPQTMANVFIAKFIHVQSLILLFMLSFNVFMFLVAVAGHFVDPSLKLLYQSKDWQAIGIFNLNAWLAVLAISAIQFWIGLRFKNFLVAIGIGFACWLVGVMLVMEFHNDNARFFPYSYPVYSMVPGLKAQLPVIQLSGGIYTVLILMVGFIDFERRKIRS